MRKMFRFMGAWMALVLGMALALPGTAVAEWPRDVKVERREFPVQLSDGNTYTVVGYLYYQDGLENLPVQILTHGITYNHGYWDMPEINGQEYSYARYMARRHYAVLALDLPGTGESDKPDGDFIGLTESASALHQVVKHLRATAAKNTFETLIYVGHSNGALISTFAQAQYGDAQAMVNTGWLNAEHPMVVPDELIEALREQGPYIRVPGELRAGLFYEAAYADPDVIAYDNEVADMMPRGQFDDLIAMLKSPKHIPARKLTVPVMVQLGENDLMAPADYAQAEARMYPRSPFVWVDTLNNTGHVFNGHYGRGRGWAAIDLWLRLVLR